MSDTPSYQHLPSGWKRLPLGRLIETEIDFRGRTPKKLGMDWGGGDIPALSAKNVRVGGIDLKLETYYGSDRLYRRWMTTGDPREGDVLLTMEAPLGNVAQIPDNQRYILSQRVVLLRFNEEFASNEFMAALMRSDSFQADLVRRSTGTTATGIQRAQLVKIPVSIPSPGQQRRIAEILSTVDEAIEQTEALITKTQQIKTGLMHDLFTRGVTPDGHLRPPRDQAPELYKQSPLGWIPREWDFEHLSELTSKIVDGVHHTPTYVEHGIPFVTVKNLTYSRSIDFSDVNFISDSDHREYLRRADPKVGDVLVTKDGTLGVSRIVEPWHPEFSIFVSVALLRPNTARLRPWMLHLFFGSGAYELQLGRLSAGTGLKHIHLEHFRRFLLPLPDPEEQDRIALIAQSTEGKLAEEEAQGSELHDMKRGLMHDLLSGQVWVPPRAEEAAE